MSVIGGHVLLRRSLLLIAICGLFACCNGISVDDDVDPSDKAYCDYPTPTPGQPNKTRDDLKINGTLDQLKGKKADCIWYVGKDSSNFSVFLIINTIILSPNDSLSLISRNSNKTIVQLYGSQTAGIILTNEKNISIQLKLSNDSFDRTFLVKYSFGSNGEQIQNIVNAGRFFFIYGVGNPSPFEKFDLTFKTTDGSKLLIDFERFDIKGSKAFVDIDKAENVDNSTAFTSKSPSFILSSDANVNFDLEKIENGTELRINYDVVTALCSDYVKIESSYIDKNVSTILVLPKPNELLSLPSFKCFSLFDIQTDKNQVAFANVLLTDFKFQNAFDSLLILDGDRRNSSVIAAILPQYLDNYGKRFLYSSSSKLWVMYNSPIVVNKTKSIFTINIEARSLGGIVSNIDANGTEINVAKGSKTESFPIVFVYEVEEGKQAVLSMSDLKILPKASDKYMSVYNSIARTKDNLPIISLLSQTDPPDFVASDTNQIRVEIESVDDAFKARLIAVEKGCHATANLDTYSTDAYSISGGCKQVCSWLIPSRNDNNGQFVLKLSQLNLPAKDDQIVLEQFLNTTSTVFSLNGNLSVTEFPDVILNSTFSYTLYTKRKCVNINSTLSLSASVTYVKQISSTQTINVTASVNTSIISINYPNYYPIGNYPIWVFNGTATQSVLITFFDLQLSSNHELIIRDPKRTEVKYNRNSTLPSDYIATFPSFMNFSANAVNSSPFSARGFNLSLTLVEYGGYVELNPKTGGSVGISNTTGVSKCIWIVTVPNTKGNITIIEFNVPSGLANGNLVIYDSSSIRDSEHIMNFTYFTQNNTTPKSSANTVVIIYAKRDEKSLLTPISFNFTSKDCNYSLCDNRQRCMIEEFWCNGINDCGDWSDEKYCSGPVPQPPPPEPQPAPPTRSGVNGWVVLFVICPLCVGLGVIGTIYGPTFMRRFRRGRYTEFQDFSEVS